MKLYAGRTIDHQDLSRLWPIAPHFRSMWHRGGFRVVDVPGHHRRSTNEELTYFAGRERLTTVIDDGRRLG